MNIMYSPSEPWEIKNDFGEYGISNPNLPTDYGWYVKGRKSLCERKKQPNDLLASISDGRLQRVTQILKENLENGGRSYLLLEGSLKCDSNGYIISGRRSTGWAIDKVSELVSTIQEQGIELLLSPSIKETALVIISQARWEFKDRHKALNTRPGPIDAWGRPSYATYVLYSFQGIPGVGADIAEILYEAAPTWADLVGMSVADLAALKHFGKKRSESVYKFIHEGKL